MVEYNTIKNCRLCRARFVVGRSESKKIFCSTKCEKSAYKQYKF